MAWARVIGDKAIPVKVAGRVCWVYVAPGGWPEGHQRAWKRDLRATIFHKKWKNISKVKPVVNVDAITVPKNGNSKGLFMVCRACGYNNYIPPPLNERDCVVCGQRVSLL